MSFKRFDLEDIVVSSDSVSTPAWSNSATTLATFYTSSTQVGNTGGDYYFNIYQADPDDSTAAIQFSIAYGDLLGSGSIPFNTSVAGNSPSSVIYKQYRNLVLGTEEDNFIFGNVSGSHIYAVAVERARFKEKLLPGSLTLTLATVAGTIKITDNSNYTSTVTYTDAGRVYELISGSEGSITSAPLTSDGYTIGSGSYGKFLPDVGVILLNGKALDASFASGGLALGTSFGTASNSANKTKLFNAIGSGGDFVLRSEETISSNYVFVRARNSEFNYSTNPSNITGSGELRHDIMVDSPQAYVTSVGLYNDNNDLLAVAKLSRPLLKDFTKEALIRIKLDY